MKIDGISTAKVMIEGTAPLLMNSPRALIPTDPLTQEFNEIKSKNNRAKTESDLLKMLELEFMLGLYETEADGVAIPDYVLEACIRDGAKTKNNGKKVTAGLQVNPVFVPLIYDGPKTGTELYKDKNFVDTRPIKLKQSTSVLRCRPRFNNWALAFEVQIIDSVLTRSDVESALTTAGIIKGLLDYRPKFGRFKVNSFQWLN